MNKLKRFLEILIASSFLTGAFFVTNAEEIDKTKTENANTTKTVMGMNNSKNDLSEHIDKTKTKKGNNAKDESYNDYELVIDYFFKDAGMDYDLFKSRSQTNPNKCVQNNPNEPVQNKSEDGKIVEKQRKMNASHVYALYFILKNINEYVKGYDLTKDFDSGITNDDGKLGVYGSHWMFGLTDKDKNVFNDVINNINNALKKAKKERSFNITNLTKEEFENLKPEIMKKLFGGDKEKRISRLKNELKKGVDKNSLIEGLSKDEIAKEINTYEKGRKDLLNVKFEDVKKACGKFKFHKNLRVEKFLASEAKG